MTPHDRNGQLLLASSASFKLHRLWFPVGFGRGAWKRSRVTQTGVPPLPPAVEGEAARHSGAGGGASGGAGGVEGMAGAGRRFRWPRDRAHAVAALIVASLALAGGPSGGPRRAGGRGGALRSTASSGLLVSPRLRGGRARTRADRGRGLKGIHCVADAPSGERHP